MAIGPFLNYSLPGLYGPTSSEIIKDERGYVMGWAPIEFWHGDYPPTIFKSVKEMARDIFVKHAKMIEHPWDINIDNIPFYGIIKVQWKPEVSCSLMSGTSVKGLNSEEFLNELTEQLILLSKLLPFI